MTSNRLLLIALLSGFAGLGSETLFIHVLEATVGAAPVVSFAIVVGFIVGIGAGSLASARFARPWKVEASVALFNLVLLVGFDVIRPFVAGIAGRIAIVAGPNIGAALLGILLTGPVAFLLGVTLPVVVEGAKDGVIAYAVHALGAMLGVALIEGVIYPNWGLNGGLGLLVALHVITAALLYGRAFELPKLTMGPPSKALVIVGLAGGAYQALWLLLSALVFQPRYFIAPLVIVASLLGLFVGSVLWRKFRFSLSATMMWVAIGISVSVVATAVVVTLPQSNEINASVGVLVLLVAPGSVPLGAIWPAFLCSHEIDRTRAGGALLSLALGNALGVFIAGAVITPLMSADEGLMFVAVFAAICGLGRAGRALQVACGLMLLVGFGGAIHTTDESLLARMPGHATSRIEVEKIFRGPGEVTAIYRQDNLRRLYQNGQSPIVLSRGAESLISAVGAAYAREHRRVLVLGAGSGRSAGRRRCSSNARTFSTSAARSRLSFASYVQKTMESCREIRRGTFRRTGSRRRISSV